MKKITTALLAFLLISTSVAASDFLWTIVPVQNIKYTSFSVMCKEGDGVYKLIAKPLGNTTRLILKDTTIAKSGDFSCYMKAHSYDITDNLKKEKISIASKYIKFALTNYSVIRAKPKPPANFRIQ